MTESRLRHTWVAGAWAALFLLADGGVAGTWSGQLVSSWMSRAPEIDGQIQAVEWAEAVELDLGQGVLLRIGNDGRTLYLSVLDPRPAAAGQDHALDRLDLFFDDESVNVPRLDDNWWGAVCHASPTVGDGAISFAFTGEVDYVEWFDTHAGGTQQCPAQPIGDRLSSAVEPQGVGVSYEVALPLDGPTPLHAAPGQRIGISVGLVAPHSGPGPICYRDPCDNQPFSYQNLVLAALGCNAGTERFGSGAPQIGLPLDWSSSMLQGTGPGWVQSLPPLWGDPVTCGSNETGGVDAAACAANALYTSTLARSGLAVTLSVAGQTTASVRFRTLFFQGDPNDVVQFLSIWEDATAFSLEVWQNNDHTAGEIVELAIPLDPLDLPIVMRFDHQTTLAGGLEGGYAQIDDVELLCGPVLFADDFESGLSTHWSATF